MLGKMILTLFVFWTIIMLRAAIKWPTRPEEEEEEEEWAHRRFAIVCHYCGAMEETDDRFGGASDNPNRWNKFACTKCKEGGKGAEYRIGGSNRANGT
jgi:hypothetical protein